jgi:transposase-like protein
VSRSTISTFKLFEMFPDQETARVYLELRMWPDGPRCPFCASERINVRKGGYYRCLACDEGENFTVRTNTVMERSKIPLHKWVYAMYLLVTARKGISSMQLAKEIGVTQKSAWFMLHRLREACGSDDDVDKLRGVVEVDGLFFRHETVNHSAGEYARGAAHTNSIESVWAVLKRGLHGVYHHASPKHLGRYIDEFTFRLNDGKVARHTLERLDSFIDALKGKRLTYARLIA